MYTKEEFKLRFRDIDSDELIERALRGLTEEANQTTFEVLAERGFEGHALDTKVSEVKRGSLRQTSATNECDFCGRSTFLSRVVDGTQKFCSARCRDETRLLEKSVDLANDLILDHAVALRNGKCPVCSKAGGVIEMRPTYHTFAFIWFSRSSVTTTLSCRACGKRSNLLALLSCAFFGWWSPRGLIRTPIAIWKNISTIRKQDLAEPSAQLFYRARLDLAKRMPADVSGLMALAKGNGVDSLVPDR